MTYDTYGATGSGRRIDDDLARTDGGRRRRAGGPGDGRRPGARVSPPRVPGALRAGAAAASPAGPVPAASTPALDWSDARAAMLPLFLAAALGVILSLMSWEHPTPL